MHEHYAWLHLISIQLYIYSCIEIRCIYEHHHSPPYLCLSSFPSFFPSSLSSFLSFSLTLLLSYPTSHHLAEWAGDVHLHMCARVHRSELWGRHWRVRFQSLCKWIHMLCEFDSGPLDTLPAWYSGIDSMTCVGQLSLCMQVYSHLTECEKYISVFYSM